MRCGLRRKVSGGYPWFPLLSAICIFCGEKTPSKVGGEYSDRRRENRAFLQRAVRFLVGGAGIRQIIDIGTGIPAAGNVHEVAREMAPDVRVIYVDNDPIVHVHASALLTGTGSTRIGIYGGVGLRRSTARAGSADRCRLLG